MSSEVKAAPPDRLVSLDAYRGLTMLAMASGGLGLYQVHKNCPDNRFWDAVGYQFEHESHANGIDGVQGSCTPTRPLRR